MTTSFHRRIGKAELSGVNLRQVRGQMQESLPPTGDGHLSIWLAAMAKHGQAKAKESTAQDLIFTPPPLVTSGASASGSAKCVSV